MNVKEFYDRYPFPQKLKANLIPDLVRKLNPNGSVIEFGCGTGRNCLILEKMGYDVVGVDFSKKSIEIAKKASKDSRTKFVCSDIFSYNNNRKYDVVLCVGVLHHTRNPYAGFKRIATFAKKNGLIVLDIYRKSFLNYRLMYWLLKGKTVEEKTRIVKKYKPFFYFLAYLWRYRNHYNESVELFMDTFCTPKASFHHDFEIRKWFKSNNIGLINIERNTFNKIFSGVYVGRRL